MYTKCGVMLEDLTDAGRDQQDLLASPDPRATGLLAAMYGLNARFGCDTCVLAAQGLGARSFEHEAGDEVAAWTTRFAEVPVAR